jgi:hypothetical protein
MCTTDIIPKSTRRITTGSKFTGIDNKLSRAAAQLTPLSRINVYDDIFLLVNKSFVSPFAPEAQALTYDYFLRDIDQDGWPDDL